MNRTCSGCTVCCITPPIVAPGFVKPSATACVHERGGLGCAIYADRPAPCRQFLCGWRELPFLGDEWRPDRCGLLVVPEEDDIPIGFPQRVGLKIIAWRHRDDLRPKFVVDMLAGLVFGEAPTFLSVPGPPERGFAKTLLNARLAGPAARRDGAAIAALVLEAYDALAAGPFDPPPAVDGAARG